MRQRDGDQPAPVLGTGDFIHDLVSEDLKARLKLGISRYGFGLQANNGRDALRDLYEELLDAACYTRQLIEERDGKA
jgi:hypothetical protein